LTAPRKIEFPSDTKEPIPIQRITFMSNRKSVLVGMYLPAGRNRPRYDSRTAKGAAVAALFVLACCLPVAADAQSPSNTVLPTPATTSVPPDNTKTNVVDKFNSTGTADAQKQSATDIELTSRIRKSVMADKSLSTYAHNVKIVSVNGNVTLNGVVRTEQEKSSIDLKAQAVAGKGNVINDIKIAPTNP
jgi:hyperosmotically inducible protein